MRPLDLLLAAAVVGGAAWTYSIKHEAEAAADRVSDLRRQIAAEEERIVFLRADWAYLNAPARLERLVERFGKDLLLERVQAPQWIEPLDLPEADIVDETEVREAGAVDELTTGSIRRVPIEPKRRPRAAIPTSIDDLLRSR